MTITQSKKNTVLTGMFFFFALSIALYLLYTSTFQPKIIHNQQQLSIEDILAQERFSTFRNSLRNTQLETQVFSTSPITLLVPDNETWARQDSESNRLLQYENLAELTSLMQSYVFKNNPDRGEILSQENETLQENFTRKLSESDISEVIEAKDGRLILISSLLRK